MSMDTPKVGIRQFRAELAQFLASGTPVAVARYGQIVGYFIPTQGQLEANIAAFKKAGQTFGQILGAQGVDISPMMADFKGNESQQVSAKTE